MRRLIQVAVLLCVVVLLIVLLIVFILLGHQPSSDSPSVKVIISQQPVDVEEADALAPMSNRLPGPALPLSPHDADIYYGGALPKPSQVPCMGEATVFTNPPNTAYDKAQVAEDVSWPGFVIISASLYLPDGTRCYRYLPFCAGTLVGEQWGLTAAHCFTKARIRLIDRYFCPKLAQSPSMAAGVRLEFHIHVGRMKIEVMDEGRLLHTPEIQDVDEGEKVLLTRRIIRTFVHPRYNLHYPDYDLALFRVDRNVIFDDWICPIQLPDIRNLPEEWDGQPLPGMECVTVGYSTLRSVHRVMRSPNLKHGRVTIGCADFPDGEYAFSPRVDGAVCVRSAEPVGCDASDSGGPLMCRTKPNTSFVQFGIMSSMKGQDCFSSEKVIYQDYTQIGANLKFIRDTLLQNP